MAVFELGRLALDLFLARYFFPTALSSQTRRYKILNPERLRSEYGKLMYVLQDAQIPEVKKNHKKKQHMFIVSFLTHSMNRFVNLLVSRSFVRFELCTICWSAKTHWRCWKNRRLKLQPEPSHTYVRYYASTACFFFF